MPKWGRREYLLAGVVWLGIGTFTFGICVPGQAAAAGDSPPSEKVAKALKVRLESFRRIDGFPGATAAVVLADGTVIAANTGLSDVEACIRMRPSDRMLAGSIGKTFFAAVVMDLLQKGKLDLDGKIERWIGTEPWFNRIPNAHQITLRMLMNHTSGLPEHAESPDFVTALRTDPDKSWTAVELLGFTLGKGSDSTTLQFVIDSVVETGKE